MKEFVNKFEKHFLATHFGGEDYTNENYQKYRLIEYKGPIFSSLDGEFEKEFTKMYERVTEDEFIDFKTRFTYMKMNPIETDYLPGGEVDVFELEQGDNGKWQFTRGDILRKIGSLTPDVRLKIDDGRVATYVGYLHTYHYYNVPFWFAGIPFEVIGQLPDELKKSNEEYYFTYEFLPGTTERFDHHYVKLKFYQVCHA